MSSFKIEQDRPASSIATVPVWGGGNGPFSFRTAPDAGPRPVDARSSDLTALIMEMDQEIGALKKDAGEMVFQIRKKLSDNSYHLNFNIDAARRQKIQKEVVRLPEIIKKAAERLDELNTEKDPEKACAIVADLYDLAGREGCKRPENTLKHYEGVKRLIDEIKIEQKRLQAEAVAKDPALAGKAVEEKGAEVNAAASAVLDGAEKFREDTKLELAEAEKAVAALGKKQKSDVLEKMKEMIRDLKYVDQNAKANAINELEKKNYLPAKQALAEEYNRTVEAGLKVYQNGWRWEKTAIDSQNNAVEGDLRKKAADFNSLIVKLSKLQIEQDGNSPEIDAAKAKVKALKIKLEAARELAYEAYQVKKAAESYPGGVQDKMQALFEKAESLNVRAVNDEILYLLAAVNAHREAVEVLRAAPAPAAEKPKVKTEPVVPDPKIEEAAFKEAMEDAGRLTYTDPLEKFYKVYPNTNHKTEIDEKIKEIKEKRLGITKELREMINSLNGKDDKTLSSPMDNFNNKERKDKIVRILTVLESSEFQAGTANMEGFNRLMREVNDMVRESEDKAEYKVKTEKDKEPQDLLDLKLKNALAKYEAAKNDKKESAVWVKVYEDRLNAVVKLVKNREQGRIELERTKAILAKINIISANVVAGTENKESGGKA